MKKILFAIALFSTTVSLYSQNVTKGSFDALSEESIVSLKIDYTNALINGIPFDIFLDIEDNWEKGYKEILLKLISSVNKASQSIKYTTKETCNYHLIFKANKVDRDGETYGSLILLDKEGNTIGEADGFDADGGTFGSQMNLMGDAAEELGNSIGKNIQKLIDLGKAKKLVFQFIQNSGEEGIKQISLEYKLKKIEGFNHRNLEYVKWCVEYSLKELKNEQKIINKKFKWRTI